MNNPFFLVTFNQTGNAIREKGLTSLSEALKSNTTLTQVNLCCKTQKEDNNRQTTFSNCIQSIGNEFGDTGSVLLSEALKSNTTLTELDLSCELKRNNTQMASMNNPLFFILSKSSANIIGETGATSLSDALKINTTLTKLDLEREYERNNTCK